MEAKSDAAPQMVNESFVTGETSQGIVIRGTLLRFNRHSAAFEIYAPLALLRTSEVLNDFKLVLNDRSAYSGRAVVAHLSHVGEILICEVNLADEWIDIEREPTENGGGAEAFREFLRSWQRTYRVLPDFKIVVADMRSLLADMQLWLDQVELAIRSHPNGDREKAERETAHRLAGPILSAIDSLGDRFEDIASRLDPDLRPAHIHFARRNLHPFLLCSPFSYRTFQKPLGYAGDYEMVNMILRTPYEGSSLFAKVINSWFLNQLPAQAHRNRIELLKRRLVEETARAIRFGRVARIFNVGCGPAQEIEAFLKESSLVQNACFTLLDFNEETIQHTSRVLQQASLRHRRTTPIQMLRKSVQQVLKEAAKPGGGAATGDYDFIYCAGLFDYLPDRVCRQLVSIFYQWLAPGGALLVTNVDGTRPFRNKLEFILDWNLIYRTSKELRDFKPDEAPAETCSITADRTSVNVFLEIRKPDA